MTAPGRDVPLVVRNKAIAAGADAWLDELPDLVRRFEREWNIRVGEPFADATEAFVAAATLVESGRPAVLKLIIPRDVNAAHDEITVLRLAAGEGCVRLDESDVEHGALLLERLGPSLVDLGLPIERRHEILCDTARRIWRPAPEAGLRTGAVKARRLAASITGLWDDLDRPCTRAAVDHALAAAHRRAVAHDPTRAVLVHGDVHQWNVLDAGVDGYKLIDPDGLIAEPEYDLGIIMREDPIELLDGDPMERAQRLAERTGCDAEAIWEWGVVERVSTGLICTRIGLQPVGADMLRAADEIAALAR